MLIIWPPSIPKNQLTQSGTLSSHLAFPMQTKSSPGKTNLHFHRKKYKKLNTLQKYEIVRQTLIFIAKNINKLNALQTLIFQNIKKKHFKMLCKNIK